MWDANLGTPLIAGSATARKAFESDRLRDQRLMLLGWRVVRFTWRQVMFDPRTVARTLSGLLGSA